MNNEPHHAYEEELLRLNQTIEEINQQIEYLQSIPSYYGNNFAEQIIDDLRKESVKHLHIAAKEPYFGRLDFQEEGKDIFPLYIGKVGVAKEQTNQLMVIDWRAPIASMFYSFTGGDDFASYESPDGLVHGLIYLKRNIVIREQILHRVVDSYIKGEEHLGITDEFLLYRLSENKDNRLRDIVSTIQEEQDKIIRSAKDKAFIIQGVAGSGKTTVALHRIAYLLYRYQENIRAEKIMIFAPNKMFLDYISNVLPELGVGGIQQTTFTDWVLKQLEEEVAFVDSEEFMKKWFALKNRSSMNMEISSLFKGSMKFKHIIDECLKFYEAQGIPQRDFEAWEGKVLPTQQIQRWYYEEYQHNPLMKRRDRVVNRMKRWMEQELEKIWEKKKKAELKKKSSQRLRTYLKQWPEMTALRFYQLIFDDKYRPSYFPADLLQDIPTEVTIVMKMRLKQKEVHLEDLAPLLWISDHLWGIDSNAYLDHIVIDEAQDFSPFQLAALRRRCRSDSFTILGDIAQGIHSYQGIQTWDDFIQMFDRSQIEYYQLERSYRSTMEIIRFANHILSYLDNITLAKPVFRSGEQVRLLQISLTEQIQIIINAIQHFILHNAKTIAILTRTEEQSFFIHQQLSQEGIEQVLLCNQKLEYQGGISVLPIYLSKGLEFDGVIVVDVSQKNYSIEDAKLLYVGCTRALHHLWVTYTNQPSELLKNMDPLLYQSTLSNA